MTGGPQAVAPAGGGSQRLDKWLWFARITKTRTLASTLVASGKFRINRDKTDKPSQPIKPGDVITFSSPRGVRVLTVAGVGIRRGSAADASLLYEELTAPRDATKSSGSENSTSSFAGRAGAREAGSGRPTKRDRRLIDRLRGD